MSPIVHSSYETDFVAWTEQTAQQIRSRQFDQLDWEAIAEEIESLGRSDRRELKSRLEVLLQHLLKWEYQPEYRGGSWRGTIEEQRNRISDLLSDSPSLKPFLPEVLSDCYHRGRKAASYETELAIEVLPERCPYTVAQLLDEEFLPSAE